MLYYSKCLFGKGIVINNHKMNKNLNIMIEILKNNKRWINHVSYCNRSNSK
jgi:hypothetical protein